jgi:pyruvate,water dikinase
MWEGGAMTVAAAEVAEHLPELATLDTAELVTLRWRLVDLAGRAMTAEATVAAAAATAVDRLRSLLRHHLDEGEADRWAAAVTARPGGAVAGWPVESLRAVLDSATPAVRDALAGARSWDDATAAIEPIEGGPATLAGLRHALRTAGSAAVLAGPTWEERPAALWPALRTLLTDDPTPRRDPALPTPLDDLIDGLKANPSWRQTRILTGQLMDVRAQVLRRTAEDASDLLERRERTKAAVLAIGGALRRVHLELGRRLVAAGQLETVEDVELLGLDELLAAAGGSDSGSSGPWPRAAGVRGPTLAELARRRRWLESTAQKPSASGPTRRADRRDAGVPPTDGATGGPASGSTSTTDDPAPGAQNVRRGLGASPGRVRGRARVLHTSDTGSLQRGEVLIARTTDASWAPLFMVAAGVVVEEGGPLSHAAIVARELGIPAVLAVPDIVATLDGRAVAVTVDGDLGTVTIDDEAPDPEGGLT